MHIAFLACVRRVVVLVSDDIVVTWTFLGEKGRDRLGDRRERKEGEGAFVNAGRIVASFTEQYLILLPVHYSYCENCSPRENLGFLGGSS
jgi:hypothetical protein